MKLEYIEFIFENCEFIKIDGRYIGDIRLEDIKTSINRIACNAIEEMTTCYDFAIEIHKDANNQKYSPFGYDEGFTEKIFKRLCGDDITSIYIKFENQDERQYYVHWTGDSENYNASQDSYISNDNNLYIVINENKKVEDVFSLEDINDSEQMDFKFYIYDIGDKYYEEKLKLYQDSENDDVEISTL